MTPDPEIAHEAGIARERSENRWVRVLRGSGNRRLLSREVPGHGPDRGFRTLQPASTRVRRPISVGTLGRFLKTTVFSRIDPAISQQYIEDAAIRVIHHRGALMQSVQACKDSVPHLSRIQRGTGAESCAKAPRQWTFRKLPAATDPAGGRAPAPARL